MSEDYMKKKQTNAENRLVKNPLIKRFKTFNFLCYIIDYKGLLFMNSSKKSSSRFLPGKLALSVYVSEIRLLNNLLSVMS